jgi:hypothetical protein
MDSLQGANALLVALGVLTCVTAWGMDSHGP